MSKFGNVVQEFYVGRFHANMAERAGRLRGVTEPGQARAYIDDAQIQVAVIDAAETPKPIRLPAVM